MAIEDAIVLAEELASASDPESAFSAYRTRRFERARYIAVNSIAIGDAQMGKIEPLDMGALNARTRELMAQPI